MSGRLCCWRGSWSSRRRLRLRALAARIVILWQICRGFDLSSTTYVLIYLVIASHTALCFRYNQEDETGNIIKSMKREIHKMVRFCGRQLASLLRVMCVRHALHTAQCFLFSSVKVLG